MTPPDPKRESYPNTPLKLVTFELRFEGIELPANATARFIDALHDGFPITGTPPQQLVIGAAAPSPSGARVFDQARRQAAMLTPQSVSYETSAYRRFEDFSEAAGNVLAIVEALDLTLVLRRVGLRYIDELDEELLPEPGSWRRYINQALSSPLTHFDPSPREHQSAALFEFAEDRRVVLRYGLLRQAAVDPTGPLIIDAPPRGRYYLIDIDSVWEGRIDAVPVRRWVCDMLAELHMPVRQLFETMITETLRDEVLRRTP